MATSSQMLQLWHDHKAGSGAVTFIKLSRSESSQIRIVLYEAASYVLHYSMSWLFPSSIIKFFLDKLATLVSFLFPSNRIR